MRAGPALRLLAVVALALALALPAQRAAATPALPQGVELPVKVRVALRVLRLVKIEEVAGEARLSIEVTQRWNDPRATFDPLAGGFGRIDRVGADADDYLKSIWTPGTAIENRIGEPSARSVATSTFSNGDIVVIERYEAQFRVAVDLAAFPFDRQHIRLTFVLPRHPVQEALLVSTEADRAHSSVQQAATGNWTPAELRFTSDEATGWNARTYSRLHVTMPVTRDSSRYLLRIFVPIAAVIAVSVFALWCPGMSAKDRGNLIFSSLLALAAISFTFESSFPGSISLNTPVAQIISLGYLYLVVVLLIDALLEWASGRPTRHSAMWLDLRRQLRWALPAMMVVVSTGAAIRSMPG